MLDVKRTVLRSLRLWWLPIVGVVIVLAFAARDARAGEITKIKLGDNGPDKSLPLEDKFYLTGKIPPGTERIHIAFVRYRYGPLGIAPRRTGRKYQRRPNSCFEVRQALDDDSVSHEALRRGGVQNIEDVWPRGPKKPAKDQYRDFYDRLARGSSQAVFIAPEWELGERKIEDVKTWEVLVSNTKFFRPGARYCMFVLRVADKELTKKQTKALYGAYTEKVVQCSKEHHDDDDEDERNKCLQGALRETIKSLNKPAPGVDEDEVIKLDEQGMKAATAAVSGSSENALETIVKIVHAQVELEKLVPKWRDVRSPIKISSATRKLDGTAGVKKDATPLGSLTLEVSRDGGAASKALYKLILLSLHAQNKVVWRNGNEFSFEQLNVPLKDSSGVTVRGADNKPLTDTVVGNVSRIEIIFDAKGVSKLIRLHGTGKITVKAPGKAPYEFEPAIEREGPALGTMKVPTPGGHDLYLEDVVQFLSGRIRVDPGRYVPVEALFEEAPKLRRKSAEDFASAAAKAKEIAKNVGALYDGMDSIRKARANKLTTLHTNELKKLVDGSGVFVDCSNLVNPLDKFVVAASCNGGGGWWPGFAEDDIHRDPLTWLNLWLGELAEGLETWPKDSKELEDALRTKVAGGTGPVLELEVSLNRGSFVSTYLTTTAGLAMLPQHSGTGTVTAGLQLFLYPNMVDEPMWTNGRLDWRRVLGLELSLRTSGQAYGPDERFGSLPTSRLPPFFVGPVVQLIPYTTVGTGIAVFGYRRSPLSQEQAQLRAAWYLSASVEINLAGIIRAIADGSAPGNVTGTTAVK